jgi:hypothetical protein
MIFRGDFTMREKNKLSAGLPPDWIVTKNHLGFWARSPKFTWDEVLQGDTVGILIKRVREYIELERVE